MANSFTSKDSLVVPKWAVNIIGVHRDSIARLEVDCDKAEQYKAFIDYIANRGVDVDQDPSKAQIANGTEELNGKEEYRSKSAREFSGKLSSLAVHEDDNCYSSDSESDESGDEESVNGVDAEPERATVYFGGGSARLIHNGHHICAVHLSHGPAVSDTREPRMFRSVHMFASDPDVLRSFADTVLDWYQRRRYPVREKRSGKYDLYVFKDRGGGCMDWEYIGKKNSRTLDSIVLQEGMLDSIVSDFRSFSNKGTKKWYTQHGLPYRRNYLFYGPPGTGKTSTIRCLSGVLQLSTYFLSLDSHKIGNSELQEALRDMEKPCMLVVEDVDALFNEERKAESASQLTFSGLLNAMDGLVATEGGVLTVMTTNHKEKLDPALIRAGRIDRKFEFGPPSKQQMAKLFLSFYQDSSQELADKFAEAVFARPEKEARSIATVQEHFIHTRLMSPEESLEALDSFFVEYYPMKETS